MKSKYKKISREERTCRDLMLTNAEEMELYRTDPFKCLYLLAKNTRIRQRLENYLRHHKEEDYNNFLGE